METAPLQPQLTQVPIEKLDYEMLDPDNIGKGAESFTYFNENHVLAPTIDQVDTKQTEGLDHLARKLSGVPAAKADRGYLTHRGSKDVWRAADLAIELQTDESVNGKIVAEEAAMRYAKNSWLAMSMRINTERNLGNHENAAMWTERLNESMAEVYNLPNPDIAKSLMADEAAAHPEIANLYAEHLDHVNLFIKSEVDVSLEAKHPETLAQIRDVILDRYGAAFDEFVPLDDHIYNMQEIAEMLPQLLERLKKDHPEIAWDRLTLDFKKDGTIFSTTSKTEGTALNVPMKGQPLNANKLRGMLSHELLWHAVRGANGAATGDELQAKGMPGYVPFEEGGAVVSELAVSGEKDRLFTDRYHDIAIAAGLIDGRRRTRQDMFKLASAREAIRSGVEVNALSETQLTEMNNHVDRMFRGGPGVDDVETTVLFPKDVEYFAGAVPFAEWWESGIKAGKKPDELYTLCLRGKNDLRQQSHVDYQAQFAVAA